MKTRLLGAAVLFALAVIFVPMFFSSAPPAGSGGDKAVDLAIPPAPDRDMQTRTMSLNPGTVPGGNTAAPAPTPAQTTSVTPPPAGSDRLATVNIGSNRPRDVETDPEAGKPPQPTTVTRGDATVQAPPASQPLIPAQTKPAANVPAARPTSQAAIPAATQASSKPTPAAVPAATPSAANPPATAAHGHFALNLSAYSSSTSAQSLIQRVRALGYSANGRAINQAGKSLTLVTAGPFDSRAAAEAARLKITQSIPGVPARLETGASTPAGDEPAPAAPPAGTKAAAPRAGGWAVQIAAMGNQADANALRDKLRANGFDGYVDTVNAGGKQLWRVRAGPQTQRADAVRLRDQVKAKLGLDGNVVTAP